MTKKATEAAEGEESRTCSVCGHKETRAIAKLEPAPEPEPVVKPTVRVSVGKTKLDKKTIPLKVKQKFTKITAKTGAGDKLASATSSKPKVVKVKVKGKKVLLTAGKKAGKAKITVKTKLGATTRFTVKVQKKKVVAKKIVGFKKAVSLKKGKSYKISKVVSPVTVPDKAKYKTSDKKVATVSKTGVVKAKKKGKATITVTYGKKTFECRVTVK